MSGAQYLLPDGLRVGAAKEALAAHLGMLEDDRRARVQRTFYDTFDGRLHEAGLALLHADGRLALVDADAYGERAAAPFEESPARLFAADLPEGRLRDQVSPIVEMRALTPIARTRSQLLTLRVLNGDSKTVVRLVLESSTAQGPARSHKQLRTRVHVVPVRGYEKAAERMRQKLESDVGLTPAPAPLHDEAVAVAGGVPGGVPGRLDIPLRPDQRADAAAVQVLGKLVLAIEANLPGTLADIDSEFLHDLRVAVRRTRALQRELKGVFPPESLEHFRDELSLAAGGHGPHARPRRLPARLRPTSAPRSLRTRRATSSRCAELLAERAPARRARRMVRALRSERATRLLADWATLRRGPGRVARRTTGPTPRAPIGELAARPHRQASTGAWSSGAARSTTSAPPEALHELRKQGKELRYLLEFFAGLYPPEVVKPDGARRSRRCRTRSAASRTRGPGRDAPRATRRVGRLARARRRRADGDGPARRSARARAGRGARASSPSGSTRSPRSASASSCEETFG